MREVLLPITRGGGNLTSVISEVMRTLSSKVALNLWSVCYRTYMQAAISTGHWGSKMTKGRAEDCSVATPSVKQLRNKGRQKRSLFSRLQGSCIKGRVQISVEPSSSQSGLALIFCWHPHYSSKLRSDIGLPPPATLPPSPALI